MGEKGREESGVESKEEGRVVGKGEWERGESGGESGGEG